MPDQIELCEDMIEAAQYIIERKSGWTELVNVLNKLIEECQYDIDVLTAPEQKCSMEPDGMSLAKERMIDNL